MILYCSATVLLCSSFKKFHTDIQTYRATIRGPSGPKKCDDSRRPKWSLSTLYPTFENTYSRKLWDIYKQCLLNIRYIIFFSRKLLDIFIMKRIIATYFPLYIAPSLSYQLPSHNTFETTLGWGRMNVLFSENRWRKKRLTKMLKPLEIFITLSNTRCENFIETCW